VEREAQEGLGLDRASLKTFYSSSEMINKECLAEILSEHFLLKGLRKGEHAIKIYVLRRDVAAAIEITLQHVPAVARVGAPVAAPKLLSMRRVRV